VVGTGVDPVTSRFSDGSEGQWTFVKVQLKWSRIPGQRYKLSDRGLPPDTPSFRQFPTFWARKGHEIVPTDLRPTCRRSPRDGGLECAVNVACRRHHRLDVGRKVQRMERSTRDRSTGRLSCVWRGWAARWQAQPSPPAGQRYAGLDRQQRAGRSWPPAGSRGQVGP